MAWTKKTKRELQDQRQNFQSSIGRRGRSGGLAKTYMPGPIARRSRRFSRGATGAVAVSPHTTSKTARTPSVPSSVSGEASIKKFGETTTFSQGSTPRATKRKSDDGVGGRTPGKGKAPPLAKRTRKSRKNQSTAQYQQLRLSTSLAGGPCAGFHLAPIAYISTMARTKKTRRELQDHRQKF